jgi:hypothetical protein
MNKKAGPSFDPAAIKNPLPELGLQSIKSY